MPMSSCFDCSFSFFKKKLKLNFFWEFHTRVGDYLVSTSPDSFQLLPGLPHWLSLVHDLFNYYCYSPQKAHSLTVCHWSWPFYGTSTLAGVLSYLCPFRVALWLSSQHSGLGYKVQHSDWCDEGWTEPVRSDSVFYKLVWDITYGLLFSAHEAGRQPSSRGRKSGSTSVSEWQGSGIECETHEYCSDYF